MGSGDPRSLLRTFCILWVLAGHLPPSTAQWFYPLGSEDTTPEPGSSPATPTLPTLDGEEGRYGRVGARHPGEEGTARGAGGHSGGRPRSASSPAPSPFGPADGEVGEVEPTRKMLLSKPPLPAGSRRREPPPRGSAKGPGHAPSRARTQVPVPGGGPRAAPRPPPAPSRSPQLLSVSFPLSAPGRAQPQQPGQGSAPQLPPSSRCPPARLEGAGTPAVPPPPRSPC